VRCGKPRPAGPESPRRVGALTRSALFCPGLSFYCIELAASHRVGQLGHLRLPTNRVQMASPGPSRLSRRVGATWMIPVLVAVQMPA
jgi:hypothetical protein